MSVALRDASVRDAAWLAGWLPAVAASVGYELPVRPDGAARGKIAANKSNTTLIIERDGERAGALIYRLHAPKRGSAVIELIATPPDQARRGSGMKAAALVEAELRARGAGEIYAPAPAMHGIAMYFWIRLGYRPLTSDAWPCARPGVAWLMRRIDCR